MSDSPLRILLQNDRRVTLGSLLALTLLSWWYLLDTDMMSMMITGEWTAPDWPGMFLMWAIMMIGMMLPSAAPMILMYGVISPGRQAGINQELASHAFMLGYLLAWTGFSVVATIAQWLLQTNALLTPMLEPNSKLLSGLILLAAGIYQWGALKEACLRQCRSPVEHLTQHWLPGITGALRMGLYHGLFCLGCCWMLMLLLFAGGVMSLWVIAAIAIFVLAEKVMPGNWAVSRVSGVVLVAAGVALTAVAVALMVQRYVS